MHSTSCALDESAEPQQANVRRLSGLIARHAPVDGCFDLKVRGVSAIRLSTKGGELLYAVQQPALCIVAQGAKRVWLDKRVYEYDASRILVFCVDLPVAGEVTRASPSEPYLCFMLAMDRQQIASLLPTVYPVGPPPVVADEGLFVGPVTDDMVGYAITMLELAAADEVDEGRRHSVVEELLLALLRSPVGPRVAQVAVSDSGIHRVASAITWLRGNFSQPVNVEELAAMVHMSVSSFHKHFKAVTAMSPLQFQKALRLQEARRIMLAGGADAAAASRHVGYASASQFNREFARFFGSSPRRYVDQLRAGDERRVDAVGSP